MKRYALLLGVLVMPAISLAQNGEVIISERVISSTPAQGQPAQTVSYAAPVVSTPASTSSVLMIVNNKRRNRGLPALAFDPTLTSVAQRKSQNRASRRNTGHDGSHRGGARVEGVGYAYGGNLPAKFSTCYLYSTGYRYAGAAIAYDRSGRAYYTLLLR